MADDMVIGGVSIDPELYRRGILAGLGHGQLITWLHNYGPGLVTTITSIIEMFGGAAKPVSPVPPAPVTTNPTSLTAKHLEAAFQTIDMSAWFASILKNYKDQIESDIDSGEGEVFDLLVSLASSRAPMVVAILNQYREMVLKDGHTEVADLIEELIGMLGGN